MASIRSGWRVWVPLLVFTLVTVCAATPVDFGRQVEPVLRSRCYMCHGPQQQMSGLRLDQKDAAVRGGNSGPVIRPGKSSESRLIRLVSGVDAKIKMPPAGPPLSAD